MEADVEALVTGTADRHGRLDVLVNSAGDPGPGGSIADVDLDRFQKTFAVHLGGVLLGMKHASRVMLRQGHGSIVDIASTTGRLAGWSGLGYSSAKAAVIYLTRGAAVELGEKGIRVNSISPGAIVTGIFGKNAGLEGSKADKVAGVVKEAFAKIQPIPRAGMPEDIAQAAVFLASDGSGFINGQDIVIDGGHTAVTRGWSFTVAARGEMSKRLKEAAAAL